MQYLSKSDVTSPQIHCLFKLLGIPSPDRFSLGGAHGSMKALSNWEAARSDKDQLHAKTKSYTYDKIGTGSYKHTQRGLRFLGLITQME